MSQDERPQVDYLVDRREVYGQKCLQLTRTNGRMLRRSDPLSRNFARSARQGVTQTRIFLNGRKSSVDYNTKLIQARSR